MSSAPGERGAEPGGTLRQRTRAWRQRAIVDAVTVLLVQQGCRELTMDEVDAHAGVAKGSLYLNANNREGLVGEVLDRWSSEVARDAAASGDPREQAAGVCDALFVGMASGGQEGVPAFPCCLHTVAHAPMAGASDGGRCWRLAVSRRARRSCEWAKSPTR